MEVCECLETAHHKHEVCAHLLSACKHGGLLEPGERQWEGREEEGGGGTRERGREETLCRSHRLYAVLLACPRTVFGAVGCAYAILEGSTHVSCDGNDISCSSAM